MTGQIGIWFPTQGMNATDAATLAQRIEAHLDAGATQVLLHPLHPEHGLGVPDWKAFEALAPGN